MKKLLFIFVFLLTALSTVAFAQQEAHIFIPTLKTDKLIYSQGETIKTEIEIDNNSDLRQSDMYISTSLSGLVGEQKVELNTISHEKGLYLEGNSRRKITVNHLVDADFNGPVDFVVTALLSDGTIVGKKSNLINVMNSNSKSIILMDNFSVNINSKKFPPQSGPTVSEKDVANLTFKTGDLVKENIQVQPKINLYNRVKTTNVSLKEVISEKITLKSNTEYTIPLPKDMKPLVYEGVLSFDADPFYNIPSLYFRYIVEGPIGTIINANASELNVKKNETIKVRVEYAGTPTNITNQGVLDLENINKNGEIVIDVPENINIEKLSQEEIRKLTEEQTKVTIVTSTSQGSSTLPSAFIKVSLFDKENNKIGEGEAEVNLSDTGVVNIDVTLNKSAKGFIVKAEMAFTDGTILSSYQTDLPSEQELKKSYDLKSPWVAYLFYAIGFLFFVLVIVFLRKNKDKIPLVSILILLISAFLYTDKINALSVEFQSLANASDYFKVNAIYSPGPSDSVSYAPGESFTLSLNASYVACSNAGFTNSLYGPPDDWWNLNLDDLASTFNYQQLIKTGGKWSKYYVYDYGSIAGCVGDYCGNVLALPRFNEWWTKTGSLSSVSKGVLVSGFYTPSVGKGGRSLYVTNGWGSSLVQVTKHEYTSKYDISPSYRYYMPTTPGFHNMHFMLTNSANGNTASVRIVSQKICVRGSGVCPGETVGVCTNLTGNYTLENGIIKKDGVVQSLVMDPVTGVCSSPMGSSFCTASTNESRNTSEVNWVYSDTTNPQTGYEVQVATDDKFLNIKETFVAPVNTDVSKTRSLDVSDLDPNTKYYYQVKTQKQNGVWGEYTSCTSVPAVKASADPGDTYATINWEYLDVLPQTNYEVHVATDPDFNNKIVNVKGSNLALNVSKDNFIVAFVKRIFGGDTVSAAGNIAYTKDYFTSDLIAGNTYHVRVRASNENGWGEWSIITFTTNNSGEFSCSGNTVELGGESVYTARPSTGAIYQWKDENKNPIANETSNTYEKTFTTVDSFKRYVDIKKDGETEFHEEFCYATVDCGNIPSDTECIDGFKTTYYCDPGGDIKPRTESCGIDPTTPKAGFYFKPNTADSNGNCPLYFAPEDVLSCTISSRGNTSPTTLSYPISGQGKAIGTYTIKCLSTDGTTVKTFGPESCYSNSDIREGN